MSVQQGELFETRLCKWCGRLFRVWCRRYYCSDRCAKLAARQKNKLWRRAGRAKTVTYETRLCARDECRRLFRVMVQNQIYCSSRCCDCTDVERRQKAVKELMDWRRKIGLPLKPSIRTCLRCGKQFPSEHTSNRICPECKKRSDSLDSRYYTSPDDWGMKVW